LPEQQRTVSAGALLCLPRPASEYRIRVVLMHLILVGLSHKTAPVEIRERLTFPAHGAEAG